MEIATVLVEFPHLVKINFAICHQMGKEIVTGSATERDKFHSDNISARFWLR